MTNLPYLSIVRGPPLAEESGLGALTIPGFIYDVTVRFSGKEALVQRGGDGKSERWTYSDLWVRSNEVAKSLIACGLGKGDCVGVLMTNRAEFLSAVFGIALAGGVASPLSTFSTPEELEYLLARSACSILLAERHVLKKDFSQIIAGLDPAISRSRPGALNSPKFPFLQRIVMLGSTDSPGMIESWDNFIALGAAIAQSLVDSRAGSIQPADPGLLFFSSGSTSKPKGILNSHRGAALQMWRMGPHQGLDADVRSWTANGFFWSGNFVMVLGATLASGGALVLQNTFRPEEALDLMQAEKVSFPFAWPHQWAELTAASNWNAVDLSSLKYAGKATPLASHPTVKTSWIEPVHAYGNTETLTLATGYPAGTTPEQSLSSHGVPLPGVVLKIVDPLSGETVPLGARGEIAVKGPALMLGYCGVPLSESLDEHGYFRTGDGGYVDAEGRLFWEGRLNDIIKTGGANVSPAEIDSVVRTFPGVKFSQTVGVPHDTLGELVVACVVAHDNAALSEESMRTFVREKLASYKVPRRIVFVAESDLQMTGTAKIKTSELRALAARLLQAD